MMARVVVTQDTRVQIACHSKDVLIKGILLCSMLIYCLVMVSKSYV